MDWSQKKLDEIILGQNILEPEVENKYEASFAFAGEPNVPCGRLVKNTWYDKISDYNFTTGQLKDEKTKNFTQIVWPSTERIGCAYLSLQSGTYALCAYDPPGSQGAFVSNVTRPTYKPKVTSVRPRPKTSRRPPNKPEPTDHFDSYQEECLAAHNKYRAIHNAPPLKIGDDQVSSSNIEFCPKPMQSELAKLIKTNSI